MQWFTIGGWICWGNTVHTALGTRFEEMPPPAPPPSPPPPPRPPPPLPFSQLVLSPLGFLPNVLDGAIDAVNMPPRSPPSLSKKMRNQQKRNGIFAGATRWYIEDDRQLISAAEEESFERMD